MVASCRVAATESKPSGPSSAPIPLCPPHRVRYGKAYARHWHQKSHLGDEKRYASWVATWLQQMDLELINEYVLPPERPRPYPGYDLPPIVLPEEATRPGQTAIAKRNKEQAAMERQLAQDIADYSRGRRMELEHELKMKRIEAQKEAAVAVAALHGKAS